MWLFSVVYAGRLLRCAVLCCTCGVCCVMVCEIWSRWMRDSFIHVVRDLFLYCLVRSILMAQVPNIKRLSDFEQKTKPLYREESFMAVLILGELLCSAMLTLWPHLWQLCTIYCIISTVVEEKHLHIHRLANRIWKTKRKARGGTTRSFSFKDFQ